MARRPQPHVETSIVPCPVEGCGKRATALIARQDDERAPWMAWCPAGHMSMNTQGDDRTLMALAGQPTLLGEGCGGLVQARDGQFHCDRCCNGYLDDNGVWIEEED